MPEVYFTADTHFGHAKVIAILGRPFAGTDEMDAALIANWNAVVTAHDTVYHLGDFGFGPTARLGAVLAALNGQKILIRGNHDPHAVQALTGWTRVEDILTVKVGDARVVLCHYPMLEWDGAWRGALHLHGHVHNKVPPNSQRCDVGVDGWQLRPVPLDAVRARMAASPLYSPSESYSEPWKTRKLP